MNTLRGNSPHIITRKKDSCVILDMRTVHELEIDTIIQVFTALENRLEKEKS